MLNFKLFFDLISREDFAQITDVNAFVQAIQFADEGNIRWKNIDIAFIGINFQGGADKIRRSLFLLRKIAIKRVVSPRNIKKQVEIKASIVELLILLSSLAQK